jgi:CHAT domain-containing protein
LAEARQIAGLWGSPEQVALLEGTSATEAALQKAMPGSRFVHLATHGVFADLRSNETQQSDLERAAWQSTIYGRNPLTLSGVVLAEASMPGRQNVWGILAGQDGILTAEEVVDMNLTGTELVVLSACDTGLGEVAGGEGVFGLQRAFSLAGATSVVASLWKVEDMATKTLMVEFYRNLWKRKLGKLDALRQAQLAMLKNYEPSAGTLRRRTNQTRAPLPPFFWAAFAFSGNWR